MNRVVLVGMMGAGKTTVGRLLAARLGWEYLDNDAALSRPPGEVAAVEGLDALHAAEAVVLREALTRGDVVVAAPGSVALDPDLLALLRRELVVWLRARPETLASRTAGTGRPLAEADVAELDAQRRPGFAAVATHVVDVDDLTPEEVAAEAFARICA